MSRLTPQIVHVVSGRYRLRDERLRRDPSAARRVEAALAGLPGVISVRANPVTGSVLVRAAPSVSLRTVRIVLGRALGDPRHAISLSAAAPEAWDELASHAWHAMPVASTLTLLHVDPARGLTPSEAASRLARFGPNVLPVAEPRSALAIFLDQLASVPVALLGASAAVSLATSGLADAAAIAAVVLINAGIATVTERNAEATIRGLADASPAAVPVRRAGRRQLLPVASLVPGDVILLEPGVLVPADARLLAARDLTLNESALTGESLPVHKDAEAGVAVEAPLADRATMVFRGTAVTGGSGEAVVVTTGAATEIGRVQALLGTVRAPETPIERQLGEVGRDLVLINGAICGLVAAIGLARGQPWPQILRSAISLAVAAVPEGLPAVATTTLALGIQDMKRRRILVRRLDAVETLGAVQVIALDKTGTLTANRMECVALHLDGRVVAMSDLSDDAVPLARVLFETAALCSDVEERDGALIGSPTETALVRGHLALGGRLGDLAVRFPRLAVVPRGEGRKRMSTLHRGPDGTTLLAVKGDPLEVLARCTHRLTARGVLPLDGEAQRAIIAANDRMAGQALRVLGIARGPGRDPRDERGLVWLGLAGLADPLREGAKEAIQRLHRAGIGTVMITGDQSATAYAIAKQLGLSRTGEVRVLESGALRDLPPDTLAALAPQADVFARVSPANKLEVVRALQAGGRIVAMTGDGINDGPALRAADIGIAMGGAGTDVAREVAAIVLADDDLSGILEAIRLGRATHANIRKVLRYLIGTNASETMVMLGAALAGLAEPLSAIQLLWLNLVSDPLPALALGLEPAEADVMEVPPHDSRAPILSRDDFRRALREGAVIGGSALVAALAASPGVAFHGLTAAQLLHALLCRSEIHHPLDPRIGRNPKLLAALGLCFGLQVAAQALPPLRLLLGLRPLSPAKLAAIAATAAAPTLINATIDAILRVRQERSPDA